MPEEIHGSLDLEETVNDPARYPELYHVNIFIFNRLAQRLEEFFEKILESGYIDINTYTDNLGYCYQTEIISVVA